MITITELFGFNKSLKYYYVVDFEEFEKVDAIKKLKPKLKYIFENSESVYIVLGAYDKFDDTGILVSIFGVSKKSKGSITVFCVIDQNLANMDKNTTSIAFNGVEDKLRSILGKSQYTVYLYLSVITNKTIKSSDFIVTTLDFKNGQFSD